MVTLQGSGRCYPSPYHPEPASAPGVRVLVLRKVCLFTRLTSEVVEPDTRPISGSTLPSHRLRNRSITQQAQVMKLRFGIEGEFFS